MATDDELITWTVHDYLEGWYDAEAPRMDRALHPDLIKRRPAGGGGAILATDFLLEACAEGEGTRAAGRWVKIGMAGVRGDIARAVVRSLPCREYLHLIGTGGGRKIAGALGMPQ